MADCCCVVAFFSPTMIGPSLGLWGSMYQRCAVPPPGRGIDWLIPVRGCAEFAHRQSPSELWRNVWSNSFEAWCRMNLKAVAMQSLHPDSCSMMAASHALKGWSCCLPLTIVMQFHKFKKIFFLEIWGAAAVKAFLMLSLWRQLLLRKWNKEF